jgi:hydrogenase maturation protease
VRLYDYPQIAPESAGPLFARIAPDAHSMDPVKVLAFARTLGARPVRTLLIGCEPCIPGDEDPDTLMQMGLSEAMQAAVDEAIKMIDSLVDELLQGKFRSD